jgi:hypothetical protein
MVFLLDTLVRLPLLAAGGVAVTRLKWPYIERYGYTWIQHPDGLYYRPPYPGEDAQLVWLEERGRLGHSSMRRGDYRYFLRFPEVDDA